MGELYLSRSEKDALARIDLGDLSKLVDKAIQYESARELQLLPLNACGPFIGAKLSDFQQALVAHNRAKAFRKRTETSDELHRAGFRLTYGFGQMLRRMEEEETERYLFLIEDDIVHPFFLSDQLSVSVAYQWRKTVDDQWTRSRITFIHVVEKRPDFRAPAAKRKPSARQRETELRDKRYQAWEDLAKLALHSVRDFFRSGGDGSAIPETFQAIVDSHSGYLNNHSARFWSGSPGHSEKPKKLS